MKITQRQLRKLIRETINEASFYGETPEGQLVGTEAEDARFRAQLADEARGKKKKLADNVSLQVTSAPGGSRMPVQVPYYIIEDSLEDGTSVDGLIIDIEEFLANDGQVAGEDWILSPESIEATTQMHRQYQEGGVWSEEKDYEAGFYR